MKTYLTSSCRTVDYATAGPGARIRDLKEFLGFLTTHPHLRSHIRGLKVVGPYGPSDDPWVVERISRVCDLTVFLGILELLPRLRRLNLDYILFPAGTTVPQDAPYFDIKNVAIRMPFIRYEGPQLPTRNDVLKFLCLFGKVERLWLDCRLVKDKSEGQVIIPSVLQVKTLVIGELVFSSKILCGLQKSRALDQLSTLRIGSIDYYEFTTRVRGPLQELLHHVSPRLTDFQCGVEGIADDFLQGQCLNRFQTWMCLTRLTHLQEVETLPKSCAIKTGKTSFLWHSTLSSRMILTA